MEGQLGAKATFIITVNLHNHPGRGHQNHISILCSTRYSRHVGKDRVASSRTTATSHTWLFKWMFSAIREAYKTQSLTLTGHLSGVRYDYFSSSAEQLPHWTAENISVIAAHEAGQCWY